MTLLRKIFVAAAIFLFILGKGFSISADDISQMALENGLAIFVLQDPSSPTVSVRLNVEAGYANQTPRTAGFFDIYSRLFFAGSKNFNSEKAVRDECQKWGIFSQGFRCAQNSTCYWAKAPYLSLDALLAFFADAAASPAFPAEPLTRTLREVRAELETSSISAEGFLQKSLDSTVFSDCPWKQFSLANPRSFEKMTAGQARKILDEIRREFYVPQKSSIYICGNVEPEKIYALVQSHFGGWKNPDKVLAESPADAVLQKSGGEGIYAVSSENFSREFVQVAAIFPLYSTFAQSGNFPKNEECDLLARIFNAENSEFRRAILANPLLSISNSAYMNVSFEPRGLDSFFAFQFLLANPATADIQLKALREVLSDLSPFLTEEEISAAKDERRKAFSAETANPFSAISALADCQAVSVGRNFSAEKFFAYPDEIQKITRQKLLESISKNPFVFAMIHPENLEKKQNLSKKLRKTISESETFWFDDPKFSQKVESALILPAKEPVMQDFLGLSNAFFQKNSEKIKKFTTKSGIKASFLKNEADKKFSLQITFAGGNFADFGAGGAFFNALAVNALGCAISKDPKFPQGATLSVESFFDSDCVQIEANAAQIRTVFEVAEEKILQVPRPQAFDEALYRVKKERREKSASNEFRHEDAAKSKIFAGKPLAEAFCGDDEILQKIDLQSAKSAFEALANCGRIHIALCGNCDFDLTKSLCESFLQNAETRSNWNAEKESVLAKNEFSLPSKPVAVSFSRIYEAAKPADGAKIPAMIPEKNPKNPAMAFFPIPDFESDDFATAKYLAQKLEDRLKDVLTGVNGVAADVKIFVEPNPFSLGKIVFLGVSDPKELKKAFDRALVLFKNAGIGNENEERMSKNRHLSKILSILESNSLCARLLSQESLYCGAGEAQFLKHFLAVEKASPKDLKKSAFALFPANCFSWFFTE